MSDQELIAKTVFGEITLGEVFRKFENEISSISVEIDGEDSGDYESWAIEDGQFMIFGEYEMEGSFPLDSKVHVRQDNIELKHEGRTFTLHFSSIVRVKFNSILPEAL